MKHLLLLSLFLAACAGKPLQDRTETQEEYQEEEAANLRRSKLRAELFSQLKALDLRIAAVNAQIENQQQLVSRYGREETAGSQGMIANARLRIRHLKQERSELEKEKVERQKELAAI